MPLTNQYPIQKIPRTWAADVQVSSAVASGDLRLKPLGNTIATIPTAAGTQEALFIMPAAGIISAARVAFKEGLTANNTNYVEFRLINKGQNGIGTTNVLATGGGINTSQITGGSALTAYKQYSTTISGTPGDLVVAKDDVLVFQVTGNGTLANTLTLGRVQVNLLPDG